MRGAGPATVTATACSRGTAPRARAGTARALAAATPRRPSSRVMSTAGVPASARRRPRRRAAGPAGRSSRRASSAAASCRGDPVPPRAIRRARSAGARARGSVWAVADLDRVHGRRGPAGERVDVHEATRSPPAAVAHQRSAAAGGRPRSSRWSAASSACPCAGSSGSGWRGPAGSDGGMSLYCPPATPITTPSIRRSRAAE